MEQRLIRMLHVNRAREPHVNPDSCTWHTQFLKENHQNSTWKSLHVSHNTSYSQICHKYIHIMAWKEQKRKEKATCGNFVSPQQLLWASCYWDDQGISCSFCAIAIQQYTVYHARFMCSFRELHEMWHFIRWNRLLGKLLWIDFLRKPIWNLCRSCTKYCTLTVYGSHTLLQIPSHFTQFLTKNDQNSTWKSLHVSHNIVFGEICHKYIHMMGWKGQTSKEIVTCGNSISLSSCCEQAAAGMLRAFPVHFVPLQSNSTQLSVHDSHGDTKNWMKYGFSYETDFLGKLLWIETFQWNQPEICVESRSIHQYCTH